MTAALPVFLSVFASWARAYDMTAGYTASENGNNINFQCYNSGIQIALAVQDQVGSMP
jgi:hypothetical protein